MRVLANYAHGLAMSVRWRSWRVSLRGWVSHRVRPLGENPVAVSALLGTSAEAWQCTCVARPAVAAWVYGATAALFGALPLLVALPFALAIHIGLGVDLRIGVDLGIAVAICAAVAIALAVEHKRVRECLYYVEAMWC